MDSIVPKKVASNVKDMKGWLLLKEDGAVWIVKDWEDKSSKRIFSNVEEIDFYNGLPIIKTENDVRIAANILFNNVYEFKP